MSLHGSCLALPLRPDQRGTLATVSDKTAIIEQSIRSILETRQGERVMLPNYGIPDFVFETMDAGFAARVAYFLEEQIRNYEPLVKSVTVYAGALNGEQFAAGVLADAQTAAVQVEYTARGERAAQYMVFPLWRLREAG